MSSKTTVQIGCQEPRIKREPKQVDTDGYDAIDLAAAYGLVLDEWQGLVLISWMGHNRFHKWSASRCGLMVPRQNGKNATLEARELFGIAVLGEKILHTAHQVKTARKAFQRLCSFFENEREYPELAALVLDIRKTNGQEAIILKNGGCIEFVARSRSSARGFTADVLVLDEAQELTDEQYEALSDTISAGPLKNPQIIFTGTPPGPTAPGEVLERVRNDAIAGKDNRLAWHEWSVEDIGDINDRERWYATNPALGIRINVEFVADQSKTMAEDGFARERLGWWSKRAINTVLTPSEWELLATEDPPEDGKIAYGIKFAPDGSTVSLAAAIKPAGQSAYIELIEHRSLAHGTQWLVDWILERWRKSSAVVIDGMSGAQALTEALYSQKVPHRVIWVPKVKDVTTSSSMILTAIREQRITHYNQPILNAAAVRSCKRPIGNNGGWGWGRVEDTDVTPIEACSLAYWAVMTSKRNPKRKQRLI